MKLFKDLPSTDTPINAENLNQIQDNLVIVSATEPTGDNREKVWVQKGKNLFNKNGTVIVDEYMDGGTGEIKTYTNGTKMFILEVQPSTSYTISKTQGGHFRVGTTPNYPSVGAIVDGLINNSSATSITITTNSTAKYLCCSYWQTGVNTITEKSLRESIQVEQGSTATEYEEYIEPKIYVKNDNDVYEEFIKKEKFTRLLGETDSTSGISVYAYKVGNVVELSLYTLATKDISVGQKNHVLAKLPEGSRPSGNKNYYVTTSYGKIFNLLVTTAGDIMIGYVYQQINSGSQITNVTTFLIE